MKTPLTSLKAQSMATRNLPTLPSSAKKTRRRERYLTQPLGQLVDFLTRNEAQL